MKKEIIIFTVLMSTSILANQTVGVGVYSKNSVYHAKNQVNVLPIINLEKGNFYLKGYKPGFIFYKEPDFKASLIADPLGGYGDFAIKKSDFNKGYEKLETRKTQFMGGLALDFKLDKTTIGHAEYVFGNKGSKGNIKLNKVFKLDDRFTFIPGLSFNYFDSKYMNYYIGLNENDVKNNTLIKNTYRGGDVISGGVSATLEIALTEQASLSIFGGYEHYDSKIKKSDIVKQNKQVYGGVGFRYSF